MLISRNSSVSLDLLRASAAMTVFLHHGNWLGLDGGALAWFRRDVGHSAVVIFFVLSGYVIAATLRPQTTPLGYAIRRASRIYSVAVPAVLLTVLIDLAMAHWQLPLGNTAYELRKPWIYLAIAFTFTGDLWSLGVPAFSDVPYWSLNYEVWYYIAFAIGVFGRGAARWIALAAVLALMGPKLWLLFPIWLGGVAVCRLQQSRPLPQRQARVLAVAAIVLFLLLKALHIEHAVNAEVHRLLAGGPGFPLRFSQWFVGDYIVGILTMALVYALGTAEVRIPAVLQRPIVGLAKVSFSLYLTHYPLLLLFAALFPRHGWVAMALAFVGAVAFGAVFEPQKDRLRRLLTLSLTPRTT